MTILVCPLSQVPKVMADRTPERVVSLLDPGFPSVDISGDGGPAHLRLEFHDVHQSRPGLTVPSKRHVTRLLAFVAAWDQAAPLLIHCRAGIGRSPATAFIVACFLNPTAAEHDVAVVLRRVAPFARPNETLIGLADAELGRGGRMREAVASTGRGLVPNELPEGLPFELPSRW